MLFVPLRWHPLCSMPLPARTQGLDLFDKNGWVERNAVLGIHPLRERQGERVRHAGSSIALVHDFFRGRSCSHQLAVVASFSLSFLCGAHSCTPLSSWAPRRAFHPLLNCCRTSGTTPHWSRTTASHAGVIWHDHPTHAAAGYGFGSTSARRNARGARDAGIGHAAFDREVCSGAKLGKVAWRGVSGMGSLDLDR